MNGTRWVHWTGFLTWLLSVLVLYRSTNKLRSAAKYIIFPIISLLIGIGTIMIWRINSDFGARQSLLFLASTIFVSLLISLPKLFEHLKKYVGYLIIGGLFLTLATIFWGQNPGGYGENLWLGCCGLYFQPSEYLKVSFVIILASGLSSKTDNKKALFITLCVSLVIVLLFFQRDFGTSVVFVLLAIFMFGIAAQRRIILAAGGFFMLAGSMFAYYVVPLIQQRVDTWIDPWIDPSGSSYQVIQSFMAFANGGINGRGLGLGYPSLVPISHSDFIFSSIGEEFGFVGTLGIICCIAILVTYGFFIGFRARDGFVRLTSFGISLYLGIQSIIIIGGNVGLLPLTGITLPFLSYGGSSLFASIISATILAVAAEEPTYDRGRIDRSASSDYSLVFLLLGLAACAVMNSYWSIWDNGSILSRAENPRKYILENYVKRGAILDRANAPIVQTNGEPGSFQRVILLPSLSPILGYNLANFGQTNIEKSFDGTLRGELGYSDLTLWWTHLVFGQPPQGLNIRTTIDSDYQKTLATAFTGKQGAAILLNSKTGEIIAAISVPYIENSSVAESTQKESKTGPLINRVSMGAYPVNLIRNIVGEFGVKATNQDDWLHQRNFFSKVDIGLDQPLNLEPNYFTPLMAARLFAAISNAGVCPSLQLVSSIQTPNAGWVILPKTSTETKCLTPIEVKNFSEERSSLSRSYWSATGYDTKTNTTFFVAGSMPEWKSTPLTLIVFDEAHFTGRMKNDLDLLFEQFLRP